MSHNPYLLAINDAPTLDAALAAMTDYVEHGQPPRPDSAPSMAASATARVVRDNLDAAHAVRAALAYLEPAIRPAAARGADAVAYAAQDLTVVPTQRTAYELADEARAAGVYSERALGVRLAGFAQAALVGALDEATGVGEPEVARELELDLAYACDRASEAIAMAWTEIATARQAVQS